MKKITIKSIQRGIKAVLLIAFLMSVDTGIFSQPGMPPGHGQNGDQGAGGMAPLGEGLLFFLAGAVLYGIKKFRSGRKKE